MEKVKTANLSTCNECSAPVSAARSENVRNASVNGGSFSRNRGSVGGRECEFREKGESARLGQGV
eukprot:3032079-Rhodomonas_salina.1